MHFGLKTRFDVVISGFQPKMHSEDMPMIRWYLQKRSRAILSNFWSITVDILIFLRMSKALETKTWKNGTKFFKFNRWRDMSSFLKIFVEMPFWKTEFFLKVVEVMANCMQHTNLEESWIRSVWYRKPLYEFTNLVGGRGSKLSWMMLKKLIVITSGGAKLGRHSLHQMLTDSNRF